MPKIRKLRLPFWRLDAVKQALGGKPVRKVIVVPMRIVNVVG